MNGETHILNPFRMMMIFQSDDSKPALAFIISVVKNDSSKVFKIPVQKNENMGRVAIKALFGLSAPYELFPNCEDYYLRSLKSMEYSP